MLSAVYDTSLKSMNFKLNQARLKLRVSLILGHGVVVINHTKWCKCTSHLD